MEKNAIDLLTKENSVFLFCWLIIRILVSFVITKLQTSSSSSSWSKKDKVIIRLIMIFEETEKNGMIKKKWINKMW